MAARIHHGVTTAAVVAVASLTGTFPRVRVTNRGGGDLFVNVGGLAVDVADPTVDGDDVAVVPLNQSASFAVLDNSWDGQGSGTPAPSGGTTAKVVSTAAVTYTVEGLSA